MKKHLALLLFLGCSAGCRDSADTLSRDYRNLNNEAIDALMMITSEGQAQAMHVRVLKDFGNRIQGVNDRCKNWKQNNEKEDYGSQIYTSDSVLILAVESEMNKERLDLETKRLKALL